MRLRLYSLLPSSPHCPLEQEKGHQAQILPFTWLSPNKTCCYSHVAIQFSVFNIHPAIVVMQSYYKNAYCS